MKKINIYLTMACLLITAAIYISCSKLPQHDEVNTIAATIQSSEDQIIEKRINLFIEKLNFIKRNPNLKSDETMTVDSAVWYLEAASNLTYANASEIIKKYVVDSCIINVSVTNGLLQLAEVQTSYEQMIDSLSSINANLPVGYKQPVVNDVSIKASGAEIVTLGIVAGFNVDSEASPTINFDPWYWGMLMGKCDGTFAGQSDAAEELEKKIMLRKGIIGGNSYYTGIVDISVIPESFMNPNDTIPGDNMYDFLMFQCTDNGIMPNVHICLSPAEMNFYLWGTEQVIYNYEPDGARPVGKSFISANLVGDAVTPQLYTTYLHYGIINYGILHINSKPPVEL